MSFSSAAVRDERGAQPDMRYKNAPNPGDLFSRLSVKLFVVSLRICAGMVDDAVSVIGRRVNRVELEWDTASIDDIVIRPGRNDDRKSRLDRRPRAVKNRLPGPLLHAKELIQLVHFRPDLLLGLQCHDDELTILRRIQHSAELLVLHCNALDVLYEAFHDVSP